MSIKKYKVLVDDRFHLNHIDLTNLLDIKSSEFPTNYFDKNDDILSVVDKLKNIFIKQYHVRNGNVFWKQIAEQLMKYSLIEIEIKIQKSHELIDAFVVKEDINLPGAEDINIVGSVIIIKDDKVFINEKDKAFRILDRVLPETIKANTKFFESLL